MPRDTLGIDERCTVLRTAQQPYHRAGRAQRGRLLDHLGAPAGLHRRSPIRPLRGPGAKGTWTTAARCFGTRRRQAECSRRRPNRGGMTSLRAATVPGEDSPVLAEAVRQRLETRRQATNRRAPRGERHALLEELWRLPHATPGCTEDVFATLCDPRILEEGGGRPRSHDPLSAPMPLGNTNMWLDTLRNARCS